MLEHSILNLFEKCIDARKNALLLSKAYFDIHQREKLVSFLKTHSHFRIELEKNSNCLAAWLGSDKKDILGLVKIYKKRCVLECLTKERIEEGKKILEDNLKESITFRAYSYQNISLGPKDDKTSDNGFYPSLWNLNYLGSLNYLKESTGTCLGNQIQDYKLKLEQEILTILDAGFRLLRAVEKTETINPFMTKTLSHLTQLIDKLSNFLIFLETTHSFTTLKEIEKQLYLFFDQIEAKFLELLKGVVKKEEVIRLYFNKDWNHFDDINEGKALNPLPSSLSNALMAGWRKEIERMIFSADMDLATVLEKQPIEWLEAIYTFLGLTDDCKNKTQYVQAISVFLKKESNLKQTVQELGFSAQRALSFILEANGICPYEYLINIFGDDNQDGFYWREKPPKSVIGISRARGLLFVGHIKRLNNTKKIAFIPCDLRHPLQKAISIPGNSHHLLE